PRDVGLRESLAERLLAAGQYQRAAAELERVIEQDVRRESAWRSLGQALARNRGGDGGIVAAPLIALGFANDLERAAYATRVAGPAAMTPGSFGAAELASISAQPGDNPAERLITALGDIAAKLFPPDLERWGVSARDRLSAKSGHALRVLGDRIAALFGIGEY